jgi:hypothetical protein
VIAVVVAAVLTDIPPAPKAGAGTPAATAQSISVVAPGIRGFSHVYFNGRCHVVSPVAFAVPGSQPELPGGNKFLNCA